MSLASYAQSGIGEVRSYEDVLSVNTSAVSCGYLRTHVTWRNRPPDKTYTELSPGQRGIFHGWFESLADQDEPPYPAHGTSSIGLRVARLSAARQLSGQVLVFVDVDATGQATKPGPRVLPLSPA